MNKPTLEPFVPHNVGPKPWGTETVFAHTPTYLGKILRMNAGHRGGLQYHERKDETFYLLEGHAVVRYDPGDGTLRAVVMAPGDSYHAPPGAVHQVEAVTDCILIEASNPVFDDRCNVGAAYGLDGEGDAF